ncbi:MAG TPA: hypothetical protein VFE11_20210, partial [Dongiaceae bacterium]|nr:hypothetical protein [Dongiaceae bacterium]
MLENLQISFDPALPWAVIAGLGVATLIVIGLGLWRRARGTWWRALAAAVLLGVLTNPSLVQEERRYLDDVAVVVVDHSASQRIGNRSQQTAQALAEVEKRVRALPGLELRVVDAGQDSNAANGGGTRLFTALSRAIADVPGRRIAGAIMISDGQVHDVPANVKDLGFDAPVHLLLTGEENEGDRRLTISKAPTYGLVGGEVSMTVRIDETPAAPVGATAPVTLTQDGEVKDQLTLPIGVDQEIKVHIDHPGPTLFELSVAAGPKELSLVNNTGVAVVNGVRDRLRVLLVSGEPHAGERTWRNILKSDPAVDLVHFTILRPPEKQDGTPINELSLIAFPIRELFEVKLDEFDLIIFDRYRRRGVLPRAYFDNIARYVENGGALLDAAGISIGGPLGLYQSPLGEVLPGEPTGTVIERGYRPAITDVGRRHPVTADLPGGGDQPTWGRWFRIVQATVKRGSTVMSGPDNQPLLILDRYGKGRVAQLLSDQIWLWSRGYEGGGPQAELLRRIAHWLMKEPELEEEDLRATVIDGRLEITRRSLGENPKSVEVTTPSGEKLTAALNDAGNGRATGAVPAPEGGLYRVSDGTHRAFAASGDLNPLEMGDLHSTAEKLEPIIDATKGGAYRLATDGLPDVRKVRAGRDTAGRGWIGLRSNEDYVVAGV